MTSPMPHPAEEASQQPVFSSTLRELRDFLTRFPRLGISVEERDRLAVSATNGEPQAAFLVGSLYDAADEQERAYCWYWRAARAGSVPARRQLGALRSARHSR
jgi:hypothetical protein